MTDRELLELAAKAAGYSIRGERFKPDHFTVEHSHGVWIHWDPLADDGDALRLAVKFSLLVLPYPADQAVRVVNFESNKNSIVSWGTPPDPYAATRSAIVKAVAAIGKAMP